MLTMSFCLAVTVTFAPSAEPQAQSTGFALVVTNNRSLTLARPDLQYADDDGAKYAGLFAEQFGPEQVQLLTDFDPPSRALYPDWNSRATSPTRQNLDAAVARLADSLAQASGRGERTDLYLVFAGHGDVDHGQGYLALADGRLTARELDEAVVAKLPATRVHLVLDSCNSYFMLNPRKSGGVRWEARPEVIGLLEKHDNVGAIISTSAEAVTYEWSELQSGIFSYELRSGLRGGADADGNGVVSYAELAAFVDVANEAVVNDLYRPKVLARGPAKNGAEAFLRQQGATRSYTVDAAGARRLTLRDAQGVRLLDLNKEDGTAVRLSLPTQPVGVYERTSVDGRANVVFSEYDATSSGTPSSSLGAAPALAARGEAPVFAALFDKPFGRRALADAQARMSEEQPRYFGVTQRDAEHLRLTLSHTSALARDRETVMTYGMLWGISALGYVTYSQLSEEGGLSGDARRRVGAIALAVPAGLVIGTGLRGLFDNKYEELRAELDAQDLSTEEGRGRAVLETREKFRRMAQSERRMRFGWGLAGAGVGAALVALSAYQLHAFKDLPRDSLYAQAGLSGAVLILGLLAAFFDRMPAERAWALYEATEGGATAESDDQKRAATAPSQLSFAPSFGWANGNAFVGFGGTFR